MTAVPRFSARERAASEDATSKNTTSPSTTISTPAISWLGAEAIFAKLPPVERPVEGLDIVHGRPTLIVAFGSGGKSIAMQAASLQLAAGVPVWGRFEVPRALRVGQVDLDQGEHADRRRYQRLAEGMGLTLADVKDRLFLSVMPRLRLNEEGADDVLVQIIEERGLDFLWLDAFRRLIPGTDENDSRASAGLEACTRASERTKVPIIVLHHTGKGDDRSPQGAMRGTSALFDSAGGVYKLTGDPGKPKRVSHVRPSALHEGPLGDTFTLEILGDADGPLIVRVDDGGHATGMFSKPTTAADASDSLKDSIRSHLASHPDTPGKDAIIRGVGARAALVRAAVDEMIEAGEIRNTGSTNRPRYRLPGG